MTRPPFEQPSELDIATVSAQLGRPARDVIGISARCVCGAPTVVSTRPRLSDGTPFPTLYYLSHPAATAAVSTLEANGVMTELALLLRAGEDPDAERGAAEHQVAERRAVEHPADEHQGVAAAYLAAHESYLADRNGIEFVAELDGISAGGMPTRVKCLHALVAHALAAGAEMNPIGDLALARADWSPAVCECEDYGLGSFGTSPATDGMRVGMRVGTSAIANDVDGTVSR
ncbi:MAG: DUF501 domain-containing protein [Galbitalea sp.]